jgi:hypothetical protein
MDCDGIRPNTNIPDKMGISRTFVLHGLRAGALTGRYVNRADEPVRTLCDQVGKRIAAAMAGRPPAEVVPLKGGKSAKA